MRRLVFRDGKYGHLKFGHSSWTAQQLKRVRFYLIEFATNYISPKTEKVVKPATMKCSLSGIQSAFESCWGYQLHISDGPIFNCAKKGLYAGVDNKFSEQQANGQVTISHNTLSRDDVTRLFKSSALSRDTPLGFQARLVFGIALATAMRPSALATLTMKQFKKLDKGKEKVWTVQVLIGSRIGASKCNVCSMRAVKDKPTEITIWNRTAMDDSFCLYQEIEEYMWMRMQMQLECGTERFFLDANPQAKSRGKLFKRQHLGRNASSRIVKDTCAALGMKVTGFAEGMTAHGLRGTVVSLLFEDGSADASVALRTEHRDLRSLQSYHNLRGKLGQQQQDAIFGRETKKAKIDYGCVKENVDENSRQDMKPEKSSSSPEGLLTGVGAISGSSFTFNVFNSR